MKKSIFKRIGLIALAVCVAIGSFFVPVIKKQSNIYASAIGDTTINNTTFTSSDIIFARIANTSQSLTPLSSFSSLLHFNNPAEPVYNISTTYLSWSFRLVLDPNYSSGPAVRFFARGYSYSYGFFTTYDYNTDSYIYDFNELGAVVDFNSSFSSLSFNLPIKINTSSGVRNSLLYFAFDNPNFSVPTLEMVSIEICSGASCPYTLNSETPITNSNIVIYTDTAGCRYLFAIPSWIDPTNPDNSTDFYSYRIYYTNESFNYDDNQIYQQGYNAGLADNQQNIYDNGYNAGFDVGFGQGRQDGIVEANDYSFISLIGAVVDVPVQTIRGMLNFTFLGINLFDFLMGLIAILVILFIVKLVRGG